MKSLLATLLLLFSISVVHSQYLVRSTTPSALAAKLPGFSQVTAYNTKTVAYTPTVPPTDPTPVDEDSTHELSQTFDYADVLATSIVTADGNITSTTIGKVWTLRIKVTNALNIGLSFAPLRLDSTAQLYIFNSAKTVLVDSVLRKQFRDTSKVSFPSLPGDTIVVYIVEKGNSGSFRSQIAINQIFAGYQTLPAIGQSATTPPSTGRTTTFSLGATTLNSPSVDCDPSIQCQSSKLPQAKAVALFTTNGRGGTGTLINNDAKNARSYFFDGFPCSGQKR